MSISRLASCLWISLLIAAAVLSVPAGAQQQTVAADRFVDAAGVNIHLHYDNSPYRRQFPLIKSRLIELGVRHVRDGLESTSWQGYYDRHNELGDAGIKGVYITSPDQSTDTWIQYPTRVSRAFEAYEAPNEYNASNNPNWVAVLTDTVKRLHTLKNVPSVSQYPIYGPSLTRQQAYVALGDLSAYYDFGNLHNYLSGRHPGTPGWGAGGYGSITWNLNLATKFGGGKPVVTTETGYQDSPSATDPVPQHIIGRYMPRLLLEQFRAGIARTYLYELCDFPSSGGYGLLDTNGLPKPAFTAVKGLLNLLSDPGPAFTPEALSPTIVGGAGTVRQTLFQKRNGTYYLALWQSVASWDPVKRRVLAPAGQNVTVNFGTPMRIVRTHRWQDDGSVAAASVGSTTSTYQANVTDSLLIVEAVRESGEGGARGIRSIPSAARVR